MEKIRWITTYQHIEMIIQKNYIINVKGNTENISGKRWKVSS